MAHEGDRAAKLNYIKFALDWPSQVFHGAQETPISIMPERSNSETCTASDRSGRSVDLCGVTSSTLARRSLACTTSRFRLLWT